MKYIFPTIIFILSVAASIVYFIKGDIKLGIYWIAAATIAGALTYL